VKFWITLAEINALFGKPKPEPEDIFAKKLEELNAIDLEPPTLSWYVEHVHGDGPSSLTLFDSFAGAQAYWRELVGSGLLGTVVLCRGSGTVIATNTRINPSAFQNVLQRRATISTGTNVVQLEEFRRRRREG